MKHAGFALQPIGAVVAAIVAALGSMPCHAQRSHSTSSFETLEEGARATSVYKDKANVRLAKEQRLSNGVSWRLLIDIRTGMAMPRVTWMPNKNSLETANRWFDALHGDAIEDAERDKARFTPESNPEWNRTTPISHYIQQIDVALTYASNRFVSYREMGHEQWGHRDVGAIARGQVIDLEEGTSFGIQSCPDTTRRYGEEDRDDEMVVPLVPEDERRHDAPRRFVFGNLLNACDPEVYAAFRALVVRHARLAMTRNGRRWASSPCAAWTQRLLKKEFESPMLPVLTPNGLALHGFWYWSNYYRNLEDQPWLTCPSGVRSGDPVVIPYRELEPFMKPGPLKDELLAIAK